MTTPAADLHTLEEQLRTSLELRERPVAIRFCAEPPAAPPTFEGEVPAGCSFWPLAAAGQAFTTLPADHAQCAIGSHTHRLALPTGQEQALVETLSMMFEAGYLEPEEVPGIPQLPESPAAVTYAPLGDAAETPDVVLLAARPAQAMLLGEAALRAGAAGALALTARPTCMALPLALQHGIAASSACVGNRVYTELGDDELYVAIRGDLVGPVGNALAGIVAANDALAEHHRAQKERFAGPSA